MSDLHHGKPEWKPDELTSLYKDVEVLKKWRDDLTTGHERLEKRFVSRAEFWPVRILVYGLVGLMLMGVLGALISSVVVRPAAPRIELPTGPK